MNLTVVCSHSIGWLIGQHYQGRGRKAKLTKEQQKILTGSIGDNNVVLEII